ncbi:ATP-binding cassette domain-containing protein [Phycicoccus sp. HDW14]|nr:ATP-binding cassette domain-containing protein [Phycicoccus sp. HDW14]
MHPGLVEVRGLTWRPYGRREPVLRDVDLVLRPGERVLLVGPSGAGKSTLLRALTGLLGSVEAGELTGAVTLDGAAPGERPGAVGLVLQEPGSGVVAATVGRDVAFGLENVGAPRESMPAVVRGALAAVGLGDLPLDTPTSALSGGQTQRLALAGALALDPSLLLLDEPTAMLDPACAAEVRDAVAGLGARERRTLVVVEHVLGPWVDLVERLVVLDHDGAVAADGPVEEVLAVERGRLLDLGIWVPGAPAPDPVPMDPGLLRARAAGPALRAEPFTVERTTRLLDGTTRTARAARLERPLAAAPGSLAVLVGPSGSGKSTLLQALAGFLAPDPADAVRVTTGAGPADPAALDAPALAGALAWVPQWASSTIVAGSVLDEVLATSRAVRTADGDAEDADDVERARRMLDALGLGHLADADPRELSGGEQRRLAVLAALHHGPPVLLADEPTIGQDRHTWAAVVGLVAAYRVAGGAVVAATHDAAVVARADAVHDVREPVRGSPVPSPGRMPLAARCGPLALLAGALLAIPAGVVSPHWSTSLAVLAVQVVLAVVALAAPGRGSPPPRRLRGVLLRLVPGALAAVSVGWSTWWLAGHDLDTASTVALRVLVIVLPSAVLVPWVDPDRLGDHLAQRLGLPDRPVVATAAAIQRVHTFGQVWAEIGRARRVRGLGVSPRRPGTVVGHLGALTLGLLVRTLRAAADLAVAMDARGFATARRRTWWAPAPWRPRDTLLVLLAALPTVVALVAR